MRPVHVLALALVLALSIAGVAVLLGSDPASGTMPDTATAPVPRAANAPEPAPVALVAPEDGERSPKRAVVPGAAEGVSGSPSPPAEIVDRSLRGVVAWLRTSHPERFGALTEEAARELAELDLRGVAIDDDDLLRLAALPKLKVLGLRGTAVTDRGLAALGRLPLASIDLRGTGITGSGLASLPAATLTHLHLTDTKVGETELARMPSMPRLATLKLNRLGVGDAIVDTLSIYPGLKHVELDGTGITRAGLARLLEQHPGLARIEARGTGLDDEALAEARRAHPDCEIVTR